MYNSDYFLLGAAIAGIIAGLWKLWDELGLSDKFRRKYFEQDSLKK